MIELEKPTNRKPDSWYEEYSNLYNYSIDFLKAKDIRLDKGLDYKVMEQSAIRFYHEFDIHGINSLERNKQFLEECIIETKHLGINLSKNKIFDLCSKALKNGYLVSQDLRDIAWEIHRFKKNNDIDKLIVDVPISDLIKIFKQFKFENYQEELAEFIKSNVGWFKKDRDMEIYKEIQNGKIYSEISSESNLTISAISKINKKVQSSINNLSGKFWEIELEKYLRSLDIFQKCKIIRDGSPGKPDIYIETNKKELFVLSLKNLELSKDSYAITVDKLKPEIKFAFEQSTFGKFDKVVLYLIVFDSLTEKIHVIEVDYKNPKNINIHR